MEACPLTDAQAPVAWPYAAYVRLVLICNASHAAGYRLAQLGRKIRAHAGSRRQGVSVLVLVLQTRSSSMAAA